MPGRNVLGALRGQSKECAGHLGNPQEDERKVNTPQDLVETVKLGVGRERRGRVATHLNTV